MLNGLSIRKAAQLAIDDPARSEDLARTLMSQNGGDLKTWLECMRLFALQIKGGAQRQAVADAARQRIEQRNYWNSRT